MRQKINKTNTAYLHKRKPLCVQSGLAVHLPPDMLPPNIASGLGAWDTLLEPTKFGVDSLNTAPYHPRNPSSASDSARNKSVYDKSAPTVGYHRVGTYSKSKSPGVQPELLDTVGGGLAPHSPRRAIRVSIGYPTFGFHPPNPPHPLLYLPWVKNKNNPEIASEIVFSSPWSAMRPIETRTFSIRLTDNMSSPAKNPYL